MGVNIPEEFGGGGLGMQALSWVGEEIAAAGCSLLLIVVSPAIVGSILTKHGTPGQKERWLPASAPERPRSRSRSPSRMRAATPTSSRPRCARDGDRYILNGQKTFISGVEDADHVLVVARTRLANGELGLPSLAIVDVDAPGFTRQSIPMASAAPTASGRCSSMTSSSSRSG